MPITLQWDEGDPSILISQFLEQWGWDELRAVSCDSFERMRKAAPRRIDGIADLSQGQFVPPHVLTSVYEILEASRKIDNAGIVVIIGANKLIHLLFLAFRSVYPVQARKLALAHSIEEARQLIYNARQHHKSAV